MTQPHSTETLGVVLVVDDFADAREMYAEYLRHVGYEVLEATDGAAAIEIARRAAPDVILMDLSIPIVDGWEATRRLKEDATTREIPVVALTAHALGDHEEAGRAAGCDAYVVKPCLPEDIAKLVETTIRRRAEKSGVSTKRR